MQIEPQIILTLADLRAFEDLCKFTTHSDGAVAFLFALVVTIYDLGVTVRDKVLWTETVQNLKRVLDKKHLLTYVYDSFARPFCSLCR